MMIPAARAIAGLVAGPSGALKVLDIAAGHGLFGITIAQRNPLAQIVAVDWPAVLAVASEHAQAVQVHDRYRTLPGDAFKVGFPGVYDVALVTNFLHHFDPPTCVIFSGKCMPPWRRRTRRRPRVRAESRSRVAAGPGPLQPRHAGRHTERRCLHVRGTTTPA
jgi:SAM-dependent methyltransferase